MAAISTVVAVAGLAVAAAGTITSMQASKQANSARKSAAEEQRKINAEQSALAARDSAQERRQQVREERVRRAQILQSAANTGVADSSGEAGALGSLSTNLSNNLGMNEGSRQAGQRMSIFSQNAASYQSRAQQSDFNAGMASQWAGLGGSLFSAAGGFNTLSTAYSKYK